MASKRVLIVEDDDCTGELLGRVLKAISPEIEVEWTTTAEEALQRVRLLADSASSRKYDLIVSDIFLHGKATGIDLWSECRNDHPEIPILLMSGIPLDEFFRSMGDELITPPYLPKPFSVGQCGQVLDTMLKL